VVSASGASLLKSKYKLIGIGVIGLVLLMLFLEQLIWLSIDKFGEIN
jgi:hypothetical protein